MIATPVPVFNCPSSPTNGAFDEFGACRSASPGLAVGEYAPDNAVSSTLAKLGLIQTVANYKGVLEINKLLTSRTSPTARRTRS